MVTIRYGTEQEIGASCERFEGATIGAWLLVYFKPPLASSLSPLVPACAVVMLKRGVRPVNRIFKTVYWRGMMFGAPS